MGFYIAVESFYCEWNRDNSGITCCLPEPIYLTGNWKVALIDYTFPNTFINVDACTAEYKIDGTNYEIHLPDSHAHDASHLWYLLNENDKAGKFRQNIKFSSQDGMVDVECSKRCKLHLPTFLASKLGLPTIIDRSVKALKYYDMNESMSNVHILTDSVETQLMNGKTFRILATVSLDFANMDPNVEIHQEVSNLLYKGVDVVQISKLCFHFVRGDGSAIRFLSRNVSLLLHFKN